MKAAWWFGLVLGVAGNAGCSAAGSTASNGPGGGSGSAGNAGGGSNNLPPLGDGASDGAGGGITLGPPTDLNPDAACTSVSQKAEKRLGGKADIIWVLDNSGSMLTESGGVQQNMNFFSGFITSTGIDVHVVAVTSGPPLLNLIPPYGICVAPPLGSGKPCPDDSNPPLYTRVTPNGGQVDSHNALDQLMTTYPQWQSVIRPDSVKTFVVVTDDEANPTPTAADFTTFWNQKWAGSTWRFSGVFCKTNAPNCANISTTYASLVDQTGGIYSDMSAPDWNAVFQKLGAGIVADAKPVDCEWQIPPAPTGQTFDPGLVNVQFTPTSGIVETIYAVGAATDCQAATGGWYYDNPASPSHVLACPSSCTKMQADQNAQVDVSFGCATKRLVPR